MKITLDAEYVLHIITEHIYRTNLLEAQNHNRLKASFEVDHNDDYTGGVEVNIEPITEK